jgi:hypothetical protein
VIAAAAAAWAEAPLVGEPAELQAEAVVEVFEPAEGELDVETEPLVEAESRPNPAGNGGGFLGFGLRAMFNAIAPVPQPADPPIPADDAEDGEMPKDPAQAQRWQQRKQIRQQAKHMEQLFQPVLRTELEMVRQACPNLPVAARREVLAAGRAAVTKTALEFATRQMLGGQPHGMACVRESLQGVDQHRTLTVCRLQLWPGKLKLIHPAIGIVAALLVSHGASSLNPHCTTRGGSHSFPLEVYRGRLSSAQLSQ